ncbi:cysteine desulfurase family protein [Sporosarcina highlanderae]|uniref:cysteine desulfurase n=1 Tax=Sporosarcina highlanderae TaxID=3035916 RepID=A0ABT8JPN3_9BACL|nr:cysteine desulfurase family protein [Sporosarcina highlanderae]MDN4607101.1 cysteine desulfurase family protein [Sporosarcina highlanderae]
MIYLDHAATTPIHPEVNAAYMRAMDTVFGNPSSIHSFGRNSRKLLDDSRKVIAEALHAEPTEIIFTSGGTEADNVALFGTANSLIEKGNHIITTAIEHHAVLNSCKELEKNGFQVTYLPVDENGKVHVAQVADALTEKTILVSIMYGNNEIGTIQPIKEIGELLKGHQAVFHTDAVQAFGVVELDVNELNVDLLSASAHKLNGPKGVGLLYQRKGLQTNPLLFGGEQERKRRAGTENVPAIAGFAEAVKIAQKEMAKNRIKYASFEKILMETFEQNEVAFEVNAGGAERLPHVINISFPGTDIESLLVNMDMAGIAVSSGSACTAGSLEPSHVLSAICGSETSKLRNSVRFSFGLGLDEEIIRQAAEKTSEIVKRLVK